MAKQSEKEKFMQAKMHEIKKNGIRGKPVKHDQAVAVMLSEAKKKGYSV